MSGMLGQILGGMAGGSGGQSPIAGILQQVIASGGTASGGGIAGLINKFAASGLGPQAQSWVGTGSNHPVSPDQVSQVFSPQQINDWAVQAGTTPDRMSQVLAQAIPHVVDHLTPGGQVPHPTANVSTMLQGLLGQLGSVR